jgi:ATP/maltotriose-dependent transcriptional regulator MalT
MQSTRYTEYDLKSVRKCSRSGGAPDLIKHWLSAESARELRRRIRNALRAQGFDWMTHCSVAWRDGVPVTAHIFSGHEHPRWSQPFFGMDCHESDPHLSRRLAASLPLAWNLDDAGAWMKRARASSEAAHFLEMLRDCRIGSGVLITLPVGSRANERTVVNLLSRRTDRDRTDEGLLGWSLLFAMCLHELLTVHMSAADSIDRAHVSSTRREILQHLAQGQSNKQIAHRMDLSPDTVKYHMRELRSHFNVRNRIQLVNTLCRDLEYDRSMAW